VSSRPASFDRLRPRTQTRVHPLHDAQGKRALFSSTDPDSARPQSGTVAVECSRCGERTLLSPFAALRAVTPSLLLSIGVGRGDHESTVGLTRRRHGAFLRCPSCGRPSWTRLSVHV
jgi:predicted RNA-binding Zn-ribbon protein involved in translation (DUF1610 family)